MIGENKTNSPEYIQTEAELDEILTRPGVALVEAVRSITSPLLILGAGGKMGPTRALLARRAAATAGRDLLIVAVSRFSNEQARHWLEQQGVATLQCDLFDAASVLRLPDSENIIFLAGQKFGTARTPATTWATNTIVPSRIAERYPRARIVAISTGNVYPLSEVSCRGSLEADPLTPLGEYANAAVARERIFEYYSRGNGTPVALLRLFYAVELRYGVPVDIARMIHAAEPVPRENGYFNCVWQGDANEMILRALPLADSPPTLWNLCRPELFSVHQVATRLGELLGCKPRFSGSETTTALLGNSAKLCAALGEPAVPLDTMLRWIAHWVKRSGRNLGKPTHFEVRDGQY